MKTITLTQTGLNQLQKELKELQEIKRPIAIDKLQKARSMGDLSENSAYTTAREELALVEGRIQEIAEIIKYAVVTTLSTDKNIVSLGNTVTVDIRGKHEVLQIVGEFEADPMNKKLSQTSPIGKALIGKKAGEQVEVKIPLGKIIYKIISIN